MPTLKIAVIVAVLAAAAFSGWTVDNNHWTAKWAQRDAQDATAALAAAQERTELLKRSQAALVAADTDYQTHLRAISDENDKTIAMYRANELHLRKSLNCAVNSVSDTAKTASVSNVASQCGLSEADVEFLVRFAARANATAQQLIAAQRVIREYYHTINGEDL